MCTCTLFRKQAEFGFRDQHNSFYRQILLSTVTFQNYFFLFKPKYLATCWKDFSGLATAILRRFSFRKELYLVQVHFYWFFFEELETPTDFVYLHSIVQLLFHKLPPYFSYPFSTVLSSWILTKQRRECLRLEPRNFGSAVVCSTGYHYCLRISFFKLSSDRNNIAFQTCV